MKNSIILFLFLIPAFLFAQYPTTGNKSRLGWQTTGDGLIWRGVAGDTVNKPNNRNYPYFQLDTVNAVLYRYIATQGNWQAVGGGSIDIDSLVYATRFWVNSNFFPLQGGLLTGTGGNGFVGFPIQSSPPSTPATGFSLYAGSTGNNISWMQPDGFFRRLVSPVTGTPRQYQFMARSYTLGDSADIANNVTSIAANYIATSNGTNLVARNLFDNNTYVGILNSKPFLLGQWTTAGRPSGVTGYTGYNTTTGFAEGYFISQWENYITATGAANGQLSIFSSAGKTYGTNNLFWDNTNTRLGIGTATPSYYLHIIRNLNGTVSAHALNQNSGTSASAGFVAENNVGSLGSFGMSSSSYNVLPVIGASSGFFFSNGAGGLSFIASGGASTIRFASGGTSERMRIAANGYMGMNGTPSYFLDLNSTDAIRIPRGTTAQTPTEVVGLFRYNSDSTAYQGYAGSSRVYFATRAYARSLVASLSPDTWLGTRLPVASVRIGALSNSFTLDSLTGFRITATNHTSEFGNATVSQGKKLNAAGTKYYDAYYQYDSRAAIANGTAVSVGPSYSKAFIYNRGSSEEYEWTDMHTLDTTNNVFGHRYGAQYKPGFVSFRALRPSGSAYKLTPNFSMRVEAGGNGVAGSPVLSIFTSTDSLFSVKQNGTVEMDKYGTLIKTAAALGKTGTNINATFATDGTLLEIERKRDTTVYIDDADYDWSAAITTAQIASRFNRVVFWMTTTAAAGSDSELTLHTPDVNLMQVEYLIHSVDEPAGFDNKIVFGTNNAVDSTNGLVTNYYPSAGDGIHVRAGLRSGVYKYRYSN